MMELQSSWTILTRRADIGPSPLSFAQQRLWFLDQLHPNTSVYNQCQAVRLKGPLDRRALERALNEIRHDVLRTTFDTVDHEPVQIVAPYEPVPLTVLDYANLPDDQRQDATIESLALHLDAEMESLLAQNGGVVHARSRD